MSIVEIKDVLKSGNLAQKILELEFIAKIYESRLWRASRAFSLISGIHLRKEMRLIGSFLNLGGDELVLDLACGTGLYSRSFADSCSGRTIIGLDLSLAMLRFAGKSAKSANLENIFYLRADSHLLPFKNSTFTAVNCTGALHMFGDPIVVLKEVSRVTKPQGKLSLAVLRGETEFSKKIELVLRKLSCGIKFFREDEILTMLENAGFRPVIIYSKRLWMILGGIKGVQGQGGMY